MDECGRACGVFKEQTAEALIAEALIKLQLTLTYFVY